jgi:putative MATE family efflux protein
MLLTVISIGLSIGDHVLISQQAGAKLHDEINGSIGTLFSLLGIVSAASTVVSLVLSRNIIVWLNAPAESFDDALWYLRITSMGLPLMFGYSAVSVVLRAQGDSKHPLLFIAIATVLNVILDIVFIVNFKMGAAGAALATVIGQGLSLVFSISLLYKKREEFSFDFKMKSFKIDRKKAGIILRIGLPMAAQHGMMQITHLFIISFVNQFGLVQAAAYHIGDKIIQLLNIVQQSIQQGGSTMAAQNLGANDHVRVRKTVWTIFRINILVAAGISLLVLLFPNAIFSLFTKDPTAMSYSFIFMVITAPCLLLSAVIGAFGSVISGTGNAKLSFIAGFFDGIIFRIAFSFIFGFTLGMEVTGFFLGNTLARLGPLLVYCPYYFSGAWTRRRRLVET